MRRIFLFTLFVAPIFTASAQRCGVERWSVKTGIDSGAAGLDLSVTQPTTLQDLVQIQPPDSIPKDARVSGPETTVWQINATLTAFKFENDPHTGDSDYHLVLTDQDTGLTMIAEIPFPGCVGSTSPFSPGITSARQKFDAQYTPSSSFQDVSVPVMITGVGMFDFAHGQRGYAQNGIELHPVLDITFGSDSGTGSPTGVVPFASPSPGAKTASPTQLLKDSSFEVVQGTSTAWRASSEVINDSPSEPAHSGKWKAWLGGKGIVHTDTLAQMVNIPSSAHKALLSFWLRIATDEVTRTHSYDTLTVAVETDPGKLTQLEEGSFSNLDASPYSKRTYDLSEYIGKQITIVFTAKEDKGKQTSFLIDDCRLTIR